MIPRKLGRFEIVREIGRGAMGQVLLAHDPKIDRQVALKTLAPSPGISEEEARETSQRFLREAQAAGKLLHPHIVTIFDVGEDAGLSFIAMEYIDGVTLERHARADSLLPPARLLELMTQAGGALDYAHQAKVIHRDIKPANLMVQDGNLKVTDFGLAKNPSASLTQTGVLLGTPSYMSPEQIQGKDLDGRSDLFSLGVVLYELLTGVRPFEADSISTIIYRVLYEDPRPAAAHNPALPPAVNAVLEKALAKDPARRYATGAALVADLRKAFSDLPAETLARPFPIPSPPPGGRRPSVPSMATRPGHGPMRPARPGGATARTARPPQPAPAPQPTLLAHHPVKILALGLTVVLGIALFPRWANRSERRSARQSAGAVQLPEAGPAQAAGVGGVPAAAAASGGRISVDVETKPAGGSVFLDDIPLAEPKVVLALSDPTTHAIRARSGCLEGTAEKSAADLAALHGPLVLELRERREVVAIGSEPPGARIRIDGRDTGKTTPVEIEMDACRERTVDLRLDGHRRWTRTFTAGEDVEAVAGALSAVALEPIPRGTVALPRPKGWSGDVFLGNARVGGAGEPIALDEGTYTLVVRNDKVFARTSVPVTVRANETTRPAVALPGLGSLTVQAQPSNCKVYVDGTYVDVTPVLDLPIAAGAHDIKVVFVPTGAAKSKN
ncbi:MAG TPA: serine/threonine-protein kinase, partial [Candidatus Polarisedimenticolia bacterium]|nr:serine/threonine-protein kinase [Candidatus Polarisedimenticolia bacterium]